MYMSSRNWGIQPSEFWGMTMAEWFCEYDYYKSKEVGRFAGSLTEADVDELMELF
jgi:hypothetical protein